MIADQVGLEFWTEMKRFFVFWGILIKSSFNFVIALRTLED